MYDTSEFRKGLRLEIDGSPFTVVDFQFVKPGKGQAFARVKIKNMLNGNTIERTYKSGEKVAPANVEEKEMNFLYADENYHFMDNKTFDQIELNKDQLDDGWKWLTEGMTCSVTFWNDKPIGISLPNFTILEITYCEPGVKGDTATGASKPATLSTGATVQVPLFVNQNDFIRIDTRTGEYMERVKK